MIRFPRIERLVGLQITDPEQFPAERFGEFVDRRIEESFDLDFKSQLYARGSSGQDQEGRGPRSLAIDVASMANAQGGLIVLGIRDENGVATELTPVDITDDETLRMERSILDLVSPVPEFQVERRPFAEQPTKGFFIIAVPRSPHLPHAVRVNSAFRFPRREGRQNRSLSESEIADAYRNRFRGVDEQISRCHQVLTDGVASLAHGEELWLTLSLVPNVPGAMILSREVVNGITTWLEKEYSPVLTIFDRYFPEIATSVRRITLTRSRSEVSGLSTRDYAELHTDGSGFVTMPILQRPQRSENSPVLLEDGFLVWCMLDMIRLLVLHARVNTGAYGDAIAQISLFAPARPDRPLARPISLHRGGLYGGIRGSRRLSILPQASTHMINLDDVLDSPQGLTLAVRMLLADLVQAFGQPEVAQIDTEGRLHLNEFSEGHDTLKTWSARLGVEIG